MTDRLTERSEKNPTGVYFRDFTLLRSMDEGDTDDSPVRVAISSEAPVLRWDWRSGSMYYEVLDHSPSSVDLSYARDGLPFCLDHSLSKQIGIGENIRVDADRKLRADVIEGSHPDAEWVFKDIRKGVRKKVSVGYDPGEEYVETKSAGEEYPTRRYTKWMPYEVSSVAVPADYDAGIGRDARGVATPTPESPAHTEGALSPHTGERTMSAENQAGAGVAAPPAMSREAELAGIATKYNRAADLATWITSGRSVQDIKDSLLDEISARSAALPAVASAAAVVVGDTREEKKPWGDENGVEFTKAVIRAGRGGAVDPRLGARAQNTQVGEDGGFAVPQPIANVFLEASITGSEILTRVSERPVTVGNVYTETVALEESRQTGSRNGGIRGYWITEDMEIPETQGKTRQHEDKLAKLGALAKITDEQIEDGPAMLSWLQEQVPEELRFMQEAAIWEGTGVGQPLGFTNSGALVTVAIEGSQTIANTNGNIWMNAAKMYTRMHKRYRNGAAWFINDMLYAKILTATAGTAGGSHPMFTAPGQLPQFPDGAIYGKPIIPVEYASAEGTVGDFVLANLSDYLVIRKGGLKQAVSMHVDFVRERQALRFSLRMNGKPRLRTPITPYKGADTQSAYVALAARS